MTLGSGRIGRPLVGVFSAAVILSAIWLLMTVRNSEDDPSPSRDHQISPPPSLSRIPPELEEPQDLLGDGLALVRQSDLERQTVSDESEDATLARIAQLSSTADQDAASECALIEIAHLNTSAACREAAIRALRRCDSDAVLDLWIEALRDPDEWVNDGARMALFRFSDRSRVSRKIEQSILHPDRTTRIAAAGFANELVTDRLPWDEIYAGPTEIHLPQ